MKEYKYNFEKRIIKGKKYEALITEDHSTIKALVHEKVDLNAWDDWANIPNWHTLFMVLKKGERKWVTLYDGESRGFQFNSSGYDNILLQLETKEIRNEIIRKETMKELRRRIREDTKSLKELKK